MKYSGKISWTAYGPQHLDWCPIGRHHWLNYGGNQAEYRGRLVCVDCLDSLQRKRDKL